MSKPTKRIKASEEQQQRWSSSFVDYAKDLLKIQTKKNEVVPLQFNEAQRLLHDIVIDIKRNKRFVRVIILKARQLGISTYTTARFYWKTATNPNTYAMIITHEPEATDHLFNMTKRYQRNNPWRPTEKYNNRKMLHFDLPDGGGLDSAVRVATAGKDDVGSGQTIHELHISELAKWAPHSVDSILTSVFQCVPDTQNTEIFVESTAKGDSGPFYKMYHESRFVYEIYLDNGVPAFKMHVNTDAPEDNMFSSVFIPWYIFDEYKMLVVGEFTRTEEEEDLVKLYGLKDEHLRWRRWCIANKCQNDLDRFRQEYPSCASEAFLGSGRPVFPSKILQPLIAAAKPPMAKYEVQLVSGNCIVSPEGRLWVWKESEPGHSYIIAADVAEGLESGDFDSADVLDQLTGEQVAHWHGKIAPRLFGETLVWMGKRYNTALLAPERNNHGLIVLDRILEMSYPRVYVEKVIEPPYKPRDRYGFHTGTSKSKGKYQIINSLGADLNDGSHGINCKETFQEMLSLQQQDDGGIGAGSGKYDDRVMSIAIARWVRARSPLPFSQRKEQFGGGAAKVAVPSVLGWS